MQEYNFNTSEISLKSTMYNLLLSFILQEIQFIKLNETSELDCATQCSNIWSGVPQKYLGTISEILSNPKASMLSLQMLS